MLLTNQEIINAYNALDSLSEQELPILLTYKIVDNLENLMKECLVFEKAKNKAKDIEEVKELLKIEKEVKLETFDKQELVDAGIKLSPIQLVGLKRLING